MILSAVNISKAFVEHKVLQNVSFHIEENEKAAIVGINGAGKTTLLRILVGEMEPDEGQVTYAKDATFGYLAQHQSVDSDNSIYEELLSVKQEFIDMEQQLRFLENEMKSASGEALETLMDQYNKLTNRFELGNGYAYRSEVV